MSHRIGFPLKRAPESARCAEIFLRAPIGGVVCIDAFRAHLPDFASAPTALCKCAFIRRLQSARGSFQSETGRCEIEREQII